MTGRAFYEAQAKAILKDLREEKQVSYKDLARRLEAHGVVMDVQALINRVNKGKFSFTFALQVLAALGVEHLEIPRNQSSRLDKASALKGGHRL